MQKPPTQASSAVEGPEPVSPLPRRAPRVDILEDNSEILLLADMPGVEMDAVDVQAQPGSLVVSGMQSSAVQPRAQFSRTFHLPRSVDGAQIQATMSDGVLRLRLPKRTRVTPRQIQVKAEPQS